MKALLKTIELHHSHISTNKTYESVLTAEYQFLFKSKSLYSKFIKDYVTKGGLLTGEGIGNIYFSAEELGFTSGWLEDNVHNEINSKVKFMSRQNLIDTIAGVKKHHKESKYLQTLESELLKKP